jgi:hypothetical protein
MADGTTTNYSWTQPEVGASADTWGTKLNTNWASVDTLLGGVTNTEFLILDGATITTAELNYVSGVTSAIQTQINAKVGAAYTGNVDITGEFKADSYNESYAAVTSTAGATTINCETGNTFSHTLTQNTTFTFSNPPASGTGYSFTLKIVQSSTARTITWPASVDWAAAEAPTISTGSGEVDVFVFFTTDGGTTFYGFTAGQALS